MIKNDVLLIDDNADMRFMLRRMVEKSGWEVAGEAQDGTRGVELYEQLRPAVVFLDVEMPNMDGIEAARQIADIDPTAFLIFATAHEEFRREAFELYAFDYLVKPFTLQRVTQTLQRIQQLRQSPSATVTAPIAPITPAQQGRRLMLRNRDGIQVLDQEEILLIQRENRMTVLTTLTGQLTTSEGLSELEEKLDPALFFRCHKSYIVNIRGIVAIYPYGRWTSILKLKNSNQDALITHERLEALEKRL